MSRTRQFVKDGINEPHVRKPYSKLFGTYRSDKYFLPHESSPFQDHVFPCDYLEFTGHARGKAELEAVCSWVGDLARLGANVGGSTYSFLYGQYTSHASLLMVPSNSGVTLESVGIHIVDPQKAIKYFKRVRAPHKAVAFGKILEYSPMGDGYVAVFQLEDGYIGACRVINTEQMDDRRKAIGDGQLRVSTKFYRHVMQKLNGIEIRDWSAYAGKVTGFGPFGVIKGYGHSQEDLEFDIVAYGAKGAVLYDDFFFGVMSDLNPGRSSRMDLQSMVNFGLEKFVPEAFAKCRDEITNALADEGKMRAVFMRNMDGRETRDWVLPRAFEMGLSPFAEPSLLRKLTALLLTDIQQADQAKIPWDYASMRVDIVPDPHMFDSFGDIHPDRTVIAKGQMVCMDVPEGPTAEFRQPNGHALEHSRSKNVHNRRFNRFKGMQRCFYGADLLEQNAPKNGADNDDSQVVVFNPAIVKHFYELTYDVGQKMVIATGVTPSNSYYEILRNATRAATQETAAYSAKDFLTMLSQVQTQTLYLGQIVNTIMLDGLLSGKHKVAMLADLDRRIADPNDPAPLQVLVAKREWLKNRKDYQAADAATNLEGAIDFAVAGKGNQDQFKPIMMSINKIRTETQVYPTIFGMPGSGFQGRGRTPVTKVVNHDFVFANSELDLVLQEVRRQTNDLVNSLQRLEWDCITPLPMEVEIAYPTSPLRMLVLELRTWWNVNIQRVVQGADSRQAYKELLNGKVHICAPGACLVDCPNRGKLEQDGLVQKMNEIARNKDGKIDEIILRSMAVDMKRVCQFKTTPIQNDDGTFRGVPDSAFGNQFVMGLYMDVLDETGLSGKFAKVEFDGVSRHLQNADIEVVVRDRGLVYQKDNGFWIGFSDAEAGDYRMTYGYIMEKRPDVSITKEALLFELPSETGEMPRARQVSYYEEPDVEILPVVDASVEEQ
jgi:hypothetical protein